MYSYYDRNTINVKNNIIKKTQLNSLQVQGYLLKMKENHSSSIFLSDKSTYLSASFKIDGSMTVEAAIVIPIYFFCLTILLYFIFILNFQNLLHQNILNTAMDISRYSYAVDRVSNIINQTDSKNKEESKTNFSEQLSDLSITESLIRGGITGVYAYHKILDSNVKKMATNLGIYDGLSGINMLESDYSKQEYVDFAIAYTVRIPMVSSRIYKLSFINRCYFRNFIGKSIDIKSNQLKDVVYITKTGRVYHIYNDCSHIDLSVVTVAYSLIPSLRNEGGGKYKKCAKCVKGEITEKNNVLITTDGDKYHLNKNCSGIIRHVVTAEISQIGNRTLCKRCKNR